MSDGRAASSGNERLNISINVANRSAALDRDGLAVEGAGVHLCVSLHLLASEVGRAFGRFACSAGLALRALRG
jgi:hypothetical protein